MKKLAALALTLLVLVFTSCAQSKVISREEYEAVFKRAVAITNTDYPLIFKVVTTNYDNGKVLRRLTEINENESEGYHRTKSTMEFDGVETNRFQVTAGFGNVFCSDDGVKWSPSKYECESEMIISRPRQPEKVEYTVEEAVLDGQMIKVFREFSIFAGSENGKGQTYREKVATIDSRGHFIKVVDTEGKFQPKTISLIREQTWTTKAKFAPVVAPFVSTEKR